MPLYLDQRNAQPMYLVGISGNALGSNSSNQDAIAVQAATSGTTPVTGTFSGAGASGLFVATPAHAIWIKLSGTFSASVRVERCSDGTAATAQALTVAGTSYAVFSAPCQEGVAVEDDAGVAYRLNCLSYTSGTVNYQIGHK